MDAVESTAEPGGSSVGMVTAVDVEPMFIVCSELVENAGSRLPTCHDGFYGSVISF